MSDDTLVHFDGAFSVHEREQINRTIREIELRLPVIPPVGFGKPWVTISVDLPGHSRLLMTHRLGTPQAVRASSVEELVEKLDALPETLNATL